MAEDFYDVEFVKGQAVTQRRGIAWLKAKSNSSVNAKQVFDKCSTSDRSFLEASMSAWIDGKPDIATRYHGFANDAAFRFGMVFKWREERVQNRIYGFKMHPGIPDGRLELCVLAMHTTKDTAETDRTVKVVINTLRNNVDVDKAIKRQVKEFFRKETRKREGEKQ
ncbi:MAG: hypothetical protein AB7F88_10665 [Pyrinomonadaceae bacterium]